MPTAAPLAASQGAAASVAGADAATIHAARRLTFGPTPRLLAELQDSGPAAWLRRQLDPASIDDTPTDRRLWALSGLGIDVGRLLPGITAPLDEAGLIGPLDDAAQVLSATMTSLEELEMSLLPSSRRELERALAELRLASVVRATYSERQLLEVLVDHWWNHLNVWPGKSILLHGLVAVADREVIRPFALGRFTDMLQASARSPAMLVYLDNWLSRAGEPNENYGRELLELHTVGVESGYGEQDVHDAARVFTGWTIDLHGRFRFEPTWHDSGPKQVMGWSTGGRSGSSGIDEGRALLGYLADHPATARHIAGSLVGRFVSDEPPDDLVASAADVYLTNDSAIAPVVEHIVSSDAFAASAATKLRRPLDFFVAALRATGADIGDPIGPSTAAGRSIDAVLLGLGQRPIDAPSPAGYPERADAWLGAGLLGRWAVAHELPRNDLEGVQVDVAELAGGATAAGSVVDHLLARLHGEINPDRRATLLLSLGAGESDVVDPVQLPGLVGLALSASELQQR